MKRWIVWLNGKIETGFETKEEADAYIKEADEADYRRHLPLWDVLDDSDSIELAKWVKQ